MGRHISDAEETQHFIRAIFKVELETLSHQAAFASERLAEALKNRRRPTRIWLEVQTILVVAGNAAKLLWGRKAENARQQLREEAGVSDDSPLANRKIRNAFEHIDEKVIAWAEAGNNYFAHRTVAEGSKPPDGDNFGRFDPVTWDVTFLGVKEPISIRDLLSEFERIRGRLNVWG